MIKIIHIVVYATICIIMAYTEKIMSEKIYQYLLYTVLISTLSFCGFLVFSDNNAPFTTSATLEYGVSDVNANVSGSLTNLWVHNGQQVEKGQLLFSIDDNNYKIALAAAEAELELAQQNQASLLYQIANAKQVALQKAAEHKKSVSDLHRYQQLAAKNLISKQELEQYQTQAQISAAADAAASANVAQLQAKLGQNGQDAQLTIAQNKVAQAKLNLSYTQVKAPISGIVTSLQLQLGNYIHAGSSEMFIANPHNNWISADFDEKGMAKLNIKQSVLVVFDAIPGKVFNGQISSKDSAVYNPSAKSNQLVDIQTSTRWIRPQQQVRFRVNLSQPQMQLFSGAKATVMVEQPHGLNHYVAKVWMFVVAQFRYLY